MSYGPKVYRKQGGDELVVASGGSLTLEAGALPTLGEGVNLPLGTTTGTKLGTSSLQKIGLWNATPIVQPTAVADATDAASVIARLNELLTRLRTLGAIAT